MPRGSKVGFPRKTGRPERTAGLPSNQPNFSLKILFVLQDGLVDEFIEAADPLQLVFQLRIGEDPFAVPVLGDDVDLFDVIQILKEN